MKNQIVHESWSEVTGIYELTIANKWGVFSATATCSDEDWDMISRWTGLNLCQYKISIQILKAKAKAFEQRSFGIDHAANVIWKAQQQSEYRYKDDMAIIDMRCVAENMMNEANRMRAKAQKLKDNYQAYAQYLLDTKRKISSR